MTVYSCLVDDHLEICRVKGAGLLVFRIDSWAMTWKELQKNTHTAKWNRVSRIINGESDLFELDDDGKHMVHKQRDDH